MWPFCDARVKAFDVHEHNIYACVSHAGSAPTQFSHKILCLFFVFFIFPSLFARGVVCETMESSHICEMLCIFSTQWTRSVCICVCVVLVNLDVLCKVTVDIAKDYMHFYH